MRQKREREQLWQKLASRVGESAPDSSSVDRLDRSRQTFSESWYSGAKSLRDLGTFQGFFINWIKDTNLFHLSKL